MTQQYNGGRSRSSRHHAEHDGYVVITLRVMNTLTTSQYPDVHFVSLLQCIAMAADLAIRSIMQSMMVT